MFLRWQACRIFGDYNRYCTEWREDKAHLQASVALHSIVKNSLRQQKLAFNRENRCFSLPLTIGTLLPLTLGTADRASARNAGVQLWPGSSVEVFGRLLKRAMSR